MVRRATGAVIARRIQARGIDLSRLKFIPEPTKIPLRRNGVDPLPEIKRYRETAPMRLLPMPFDFRLWLVTGYAETRQVLTDRTSFSNDIRHLFTGDGPSTADDVGGLGFTDPPQHTRLRKIVTPEFTMRRLARLEPMIDEIADAQLDELEKAAQADPAGVVDLAKHLAFPVPFQTICALLGLAYEDREAFATLGSARFDASLGGAASVPSRPSASSCSRPWSGSARTPAPACSARSSAIRATRSTMSTWRGWPTASSPVGSRRRPG